MRKRWWIAGAALVLLLAAGAWVGLGTGALGRAVAIGQTPTPDPTAGWKTYTNTAFAYSIKYPPDWYLHESEEGRGVIISNYDPTKVTVDDVRRWARGETGDKVKFEIGVQFQVMPVGEELQSWESRQPLVNPDAKVLSRVSTRVSGADAIDMTTENVVGNTSRVIYVGKQGQVFVISVYPYTPLHSSTTDAMLATFAFAS